MHSHFLRRQRVVASAVFACLLVLIWLMFKHPPMPGSSSSLDNVFNRTLGVSLIRFQKIFVINLRSRTDHRDSMSLAASLSNLDVEFIDGVTEVVEKAVPHKTPGSNLKQADLGAWRAHMNIARRMVEQNITSALVLEDDADWDIRIKSQMRNFAQASRLLLQPRVGTIDKYYDPTYPQPKEGQKPINLGFNAHRTVAPSTSPYGDVDRWDLFWLGHCGCRFPQVDDVNVPLARAVILNDMTVPEKSHLNMEFGDSTLLNEYYPHTRVVSRARMNTCTIAYGVSLPGARRILYELGINKVSGPADMMFRSVCHGSEGRKIRTCLSVQPQLFQHHRPKGPMAGFSDIAEHQGYNEVANTINIRWSTQLNIPKLIDGLDDYVDSYPDRETQEETAP